MRGYGRRKRTDGQVRVRPDIPAMAMVHHLGGTHDGDRLDIPQIRLAESPHPPPPPPPRFCPMNPPHKSSLVQWAREEADLPCHPCIPLGYRHQHQHRHRQTRSCQDRVLNQDTTRVSAWRCRRCLRTLVVSFTKSRVARRTIPRADGHTDDTRPAVEERGMRQWLRRPHQRAV
jgi:hypothetical protein